MLKYSFLQFASVSGLAQAIYQHFRQSDLLGISTDGIYLDYKGESSLEINILIRS